MASGAQGRTYRADDLDLTSVRRRPPVRFSPWLRLGAALRQGTVEPRAVKLARLGVSGQGSEGPVTPIPPLRDPIITELELAPIRENFSFVRISYHNVRNEHLYEGVEPPLSPIESELLSRLKVVMVDLFQPLPELDVET